MALKIIKRSNRHTGLYTPKMVMRASLILSIFVHIILFSAFQKAFPFIWEVEEFRTYRVELLRPPVQERDTEDITGNRLDHVREADRADIDLLQETISLETRDKRYVSYAKVIKEEIMRRWIYPPEARADLIEGSLMVLFSLASDGNMIRLEVTRSSGHEILDKEVLRALEDASPFPPFPDSITVKRLNIKAAFDYRLAPQEE